MELTSINVELASGEIEEHEQAVGHQVGGAGELVVLYAVSEMDEGGHFVKHAYPAVTYAPDYWKKVLVLGVKGSVITQQASVHSLKRMN